MYKGDCSIARNKYPEETVKLILAQARKLFIQKGYDGTSIQDIINNLGGLSKGAIYHHFKSKEEIFEAVCENISSENTVYYDKLRDDKTMNGYEKLKAMLESGYENPNSDVYDVVVPEYIEPIIREGIRDGSIKTDYPKELAEVIITLINIWVNPILVKAEPE